MVTLVRSPSAARERPGRLVQRATGVEGLAGLLDGVFVDPQVAPARRAALRRSGLGPPGIQQLTRRRPTGVGRRGQVVKPQCVVQGTVPSQDQLWQSKEARAATHVRHAFPKALRGALARETRIACLPRFASCQNRANVEELSSAREVADRPGAQQPRSLGAGLHRGHSGPGAWTALISNQTSVLPCRLIPQRSARRSMR